MGKTAENTASMIVKTTGSAEKAEAYRKKMNETIARADRAVGKPVDPIYRELAGRIDKRLPDSRYFPWILQKLMTLDQARAVAALPDKYREKSVGAVALSPEGMGVTAQFAKDLGMDRETVDKGLTDLYYKGVLFPTRQGWQPSRSLGQFNDSTTNNPKVHVPLGPEYFDLWTAFLEEMGNEIRFDLLKRNLAAGSTQWRIIPRWKSIKDIPGVLPCEDVREILRKGQKNISLTNCPCRQRFGNRTCDVPGASCINFGRAAEYNVIRGTGKKVTLKEALDAFNELDKHAVVHMVRNQKEVETGILCNCHWDCCGPFQGLLSQPEYTPGIGMTKSRFEAVVDPEKCIGCGDCVRSCGFVATEMRYYPEHNGERAYINTEKCMGCGCCVVQCPVGARTMRMWQPDPNYIPDDKVTVEGG